MRLDLRNIIHVPDAEKTFQYQMDLSDLDFLGEKADYPARLSRGQRDQPRGRLSAERHGPLGAGSGL